MAFYIIIGGLTEIKLHLFNYFKKRMEGPTIKVKLKLANSKNPIPAGLLEGTLQLHLHQYMKWLTWAYQWETL